MAEVIHSDVLDAVAMKLAKDWKRNVRLLGMEESTIDQIDSDYHKTYEKAIQSLLQWKNNSTEPPTWQLLKRNLKRLSRNDIVRDVERDYPHLTKNSEYFYLSCTSSRILSEINKINKVFFVFH